MGWRKSLTVEDLRSYIYLACQKSRLRSGITMCKYQSGGKSPTVLQGSLNQWDGRIQN